MEELNPRILEDIVRTTMPLRADQRPGEDAYQRYEELKNRWEKLQNQLASNGRLDLPLGD